MKFQPISHGEIVLDERTADPSMIQAPASDATHKSDCASQYCLRGIRPRKLNNNRTNASAIGPELGAIEAR
jgi:hypothetical protein